MRIFLAEDEPPARERLCETLARVAPDAELVGHADSVQATAAWLAAHPPPDLLLLDIQLADGLSLDLFSAHRVRLPVIFTTAFDRFALDAFQTLAVDYLLKPVADTALAQALAKARLWRAHYEASAVSPWLQRLACRRWTAQEHHALPVVALARLVSLDKVTQAVAVDGQRYQVDASLADTARQLDPARFFRVNRQVVVAARAVRHYAPAGRGRLRLTLAPDDEVVEVVQERAAAFKAWWTAAPID